VIPPTVFDVGFFSPVLEVVIMGIVIPHPAAANPNSPAIIHFTLGLISRTPPYTLPLVC